MTILSNESLQILANVPLIDGHNDWANTIRGYYMNKINEGFGVEQTLIGHVDLKRLRAGGSGGMFLSAYVDCPKDELDLSDEAHYEALRDTLQQIDLIHRLIGKYSQHLEIVYKATDILDIFHRGKVAVILSIEGLHQIANSASVLRNYYRLGVRCATLAHNNNNNYAGSATSKIAPTRGLSDEGRDMMREMNRIGMMVDLSHTNEATMHDVLDVSAAPVLFTHSSCSQIVPHVRNVSDEVLLKLRSNGGIIMISLIPALTSIESNKATVSHVVDQIQHVDSIIGYKYIGIGSDFDGMPNTVAGLEDVSKFPVLVSEMLERGLSKSHVEQIIGLNLIQFFQRVEDASARLQESSSVKALEDEIKPIWSNELIDWCKKKWPEAD